MRPHAHRGLLALGVKVTLMCHPRIAPLYLLQASIALMRLQQRVRDSQCSEKFRHLGRMRPRDVSESVRNSISRCTSVLIPHCRKVGSELCASRHGKCHICTGVCLQASDCRVQCPPRGAISRSPSADTGHWCHRTGTDEADIQRTSCKRAVEQRSYKGNYSVSRFRLSGHG